jgi:hypothetical protein
MRVGDEGTEGIKERKYWRGIKIRQECILPWTLSRLSLGAQARHPPPFAILQERKTKSKQKEMHEILTPEIECIFLKSVFFYSEYPNFVPLMYT